MLDGADDGADEDASTYPGKYQIITNENVGYSILNEIPSGADDGAVNTIKEKISVVIKIN